MSTRDDGDRWLALQAPFPPEEVSKKPQQLSREDRERGYCRQPRTGVCADDSPCGGYHARSIHLDYVGHADVTRRLNDVDPTWTWEPYAVSPDGLPAVRDGGLWIRLTVLGVTRPGFGDAQGKTGPNAVKEMIGDALRNAAMRFGVATYLWSKSEAAQTQHQPDQQPDPTPPVVPPLLQDVYDALAALTQYQQSKVREWAEQQYATVDLPTYTDVQLLALLEQARLAVSWPPTGG